MNAYPLFKLGKTLPAKALHMRKKREIHFSGSRMNPMSSI